MVYLIIVCVLLVCAGVCFYVRLRADKKKLCSEATVAFSTDRDCVVLLSGSKFRPHCLLRKPLPAGTKVRVIDFDRIAACEKDFNFYLVFNRERLDKIRLRCYHLPKGVYSGVKRPLQAMIMEKVNENECAAIDTKTKTYLILYHVPKDYAEKKYSTVYYDKLAFSPEINRTELE